MNSRLAGDKIPAHAVRQKVESIQRQRQTWDLVYEYLAGGNDVTLESIEAANELVRFRTAYPQSNARWLAQSDTHGIYLMV